VNATKNNWMRKLPNALSSLRIVGAVTFWLGVPSMFPDAQGRNFIRVIFLISAMSDAADGFLARVLGTRGRVGYVLDPIADKILLNTVFLYFAFSTSSPFPVRLPAWFAIGVLVKDACWATGGVLVRLLTGKMEIPASTVGKITTVVVVSVVAIVLVTPEWLDPGVATKIVWRGGIVSLLLALVALCGYAFEVAKTAWQQDRTEKTDATD